VILSGGSDYGTCGRSKGEVPVSKEGDARLNLSDRRATKWLTRVGQHAPRSPLSTREFWQRSPPTLPNPNPVGTPGGVSGIWPTSRHGTRFVSPEFRGGGSGLGSPGCRALRHTMPRRDSAEPLVRFSRAALPSADSPRASLRGSTLIASPARRSTALPSQPSLCNSRILARMCGCRFVILPS
jgi:hypothetical protein